MPLSATWSLARGHVRGEARDADLRQPRLQQSLDLAEVVGAEPDEHVGRAGARVRRAARVHPRAGEREVERERPRLVAAVEQASRTALERQEVWELLLDAAAHHRLDRPPPRAFGVERIEVEVADAPAGVVLDREVAQRHLTDAHRDARAFVVGLGLVGERVEHPVPAAVRRPLQPYLHVRGLERADAQPAAQHRPEIDLRARGAELGERRRREPGRIRDADAAHPQPGAQAEHELERPLERDLAAERRARDGADPVAPRRGADRHPEGRDREEDGERRGDERRGRDQPPAHRTFTARRRPRRGRRGGGGRWTSTAGRDRRRYRRRAARVP